MGRPKGSKNKSKRYTGNLKSKSLKALSCQCGRIVMVAEDSDGVSCWKCVQDRVGIDPKYLKSSSSTKPALSGFPRGWHLKKQYVHVDGRVFHKGKEQPELKGKFEPTPKTISKLITLTKGQRRRLRDEKKRKKEIRLAKRHEKKKKDII